MTHALKSLVALLLCAAGMANLGHAQAPTDLSALADSDDPVERGRYLAAAGNCTTCHTAPGGAAYAGGVAFETDFGVIYSTNITSDAEQGIGAWTQEQFNRAMHEGLSADGTRLYPAFPYPSFTKVTTDDLADLFAYLKTVAPSAAVAPANDLGFPFNQRALLGIWNALFFSAERYAPDDAQSAEWNRGAYLVQGIGHCGTCHTPRNFLGGLQQDAALSGGTYLDEVEPGVKRPWSASNLTAAPDGLASWSVDEIAQYLKTGHSARAGTFGPMNDVITASTGRLSDADVRAMAVYLASLPPIERAPTHDMSAEDYRAGELVYTIHCGTCHLPTGLGDPTLGPPLAGSPVVQAEDPASLINSIIYGATVPAPAPAHAWETMEAFGDKLDDDEIALLSSYMRSSWGNRGGPVSEADVARQR